MKIKINKNQDLQGHGWDLWSCFVGNLPLPNQWRNHLITTMFVEQPQAFPRYDKQSGFLDSVSHEDKLPKEGHFFQFEGLWLFLI